MLTLTLALSMLIGLLLGLLGGGGSILTVPMLVYILGVEPKPAIMTAFIVIGSSSLIAVIPHARRAAVCWKSGFWFGLSGMLGAYSGGRIATHFSDSTLLLLFGTISLLTGLLMLTGNRQHQHLQIQLDSLCPLKLPFFKLVFTGGFVGLMTGMVGVGGGFLIVPALSMLVGLPIQGAIGTSLLIIALNAAAGIVGYSQQISIDLELAALVTGGTISGSALGAILASRIRPQLLKSGFACLVISMAIYVLYQNWPTTLTLTKQHLTLSLITAAILLIIPVTLRLRRKSKAHSNPLDEK